MCRYCSISAAAWRQARRPRVDSGTGPNASRTYPGRSASTASPVARRCQARVRTTCRYWGPRWALASSQPSRRCWCWRSSRSRSWARSTCWVATANPPEYVGRVVIAAAQPAKHAGRLAAGGLVIGGQGLLGLLAVGGGAGQLPAVVAGGLIELAAEPVPLGPQL